MFTKQRLADLVEALRAALGVSVVTVVVHDIAQKPPETHVCSVCADTDLARETSAAMQQVVADAIDDACAPDEMPPARNLNVH